MKNIIRISGILLTIVFIHSCQKDNVPSLTTTVVTAISATSAISGGTITDEGSSSIIFKGVCWSTNNTPITADNKTIDGFGAGSFSSNITGLKGVATYYIRAYATNEAGTGYGNQMTFTTSPITIALLTTTDVASITSTSAISGGNITTDGGASITTRGVCWGTSSNPTTDNNKTSDGAGSGEFVGNVTGLQAGITYYIRAYATSSAGTAYGNELSFTTYPNGPINFNPDLTYGSVTDIDGNIYKTIEIGTQLWMAENLKTTRYLNGDSIGTTVPATLEISAEATPKYQWAYAGYESNVTPYGRLYTWYTVTDSRNICPAGWHVPDQSEWGLLTNYFGGNNSSANKLLETGTTHWTAVNSGATNESGFTALPAGTRDAIGFGNIGEVAEWWTSSYVSIVKSNSPILAEGRTARTQFTSSVTYICWEINNGKLLRQEDVGYRGFSVRCLRD